jgi:pimeloyl-ACP methyl ester carboxylesterase
MKPLRSLWLLLVLLLGVAYASLARAEGCGEIIIPENFYNDGADEDRSTISDCANPFNRDLAVGFSATIFMGGQEVRTGTALAAVEGAPLEGSLTFSYPDYDAGSITLALYQRVADGYRLERAAYFDVRDPERRDFSFAALPSGDFEAVVIFEPPPILNDRVVPVWARVWRSLFPTALAYYADYQEVVQYSFTLTTVPPPPTGASSVLFLPGIQASRLYKEGVLGTEDQVWPPNAAFNNDITDLTMDENGVSEEDIYTRDVVDVAVGVGEVYGGFLDFLEELRTAEKPIREFEAFAYDWRFSPRTVVDNGTQYENEIRRVTDAIERLAQRSHTGSVTIVAHSNGGLVAKAAISALVQGGKERLVDRLIFLGVPHLGTPKAIASLLHGYDQTDQLGGFIIGGSVVRRVITNMPGVYELLPAPQYLEQLSAPLISFAAGTATQPYITTYGTTIQSDLAYQNFLYGSDLLDRSFSQPASVPVRVNPTLFQQAWQRHQDFYRDWRAPAHVSVFEIVGVGLPTLSSITYRSITEQKCTVVGGGAVLCVDEDDLKPFANLTRWGDETVVAASADGYGGDKEKLYLDLFSVSDDNANINEPIIRHYNLSELPELHALVKNILLTSDALSTLPKFISTTPPSFSQELSVEVIDSPVRMLGKDTQGNETGVKVVGGKEQVVQEIPGSSYFEFGDTKYLVLPANSERTVTLEGTAWGGYTLQTGTLTTDDQFVLTSRMVNASVTPTMWAEYTKNASGYTGIKTDLDGDGQYELMTTMDGGVLATTSVFDRLRAVLDTTSLSSPHKKPLLLLVGTMERMVKVKQQNKVTKKMLEGFIRSFSQIVGVYERQGKLQSAEAQSILNILKEI